MNPRVFWLLAGLWAFALGACVGSFVGVLADRIPRGEPFWRGRSHCPVCRRTLPWHEMVPVANWFYLGGRCRGCGAPIPASCPATEAACGLLALGCLARWPLAPGRALCAFCAGALLLAVALVDRATLEIPNGLVLALCLPALASAALWPGVPLEARLVGAACLSGPMLALALVLPGAFGGGDIKLMLPCGFLLGWQACLVAGFAAVLLGGGQALWLLATRRAGRRAQMPFGPALAAGTLLGLFYGDAVFAWYAALCGF